MSFWCLFSAAYVDRMLWQSCLLWCDVVDFGFWQKGAIVKLAMTRWSARHLREFVKPNITTTRALCLYQKKQQDFPVGVSVSPSHTHVTTFCHDWLQR